jgi:hypothetical protein
MLCIDAVAVLVISRWIPQVGRQARWSWDFSFPALAAIVVAGLAVPAIAATVPSHTTATGGATDEEVVLLEPATWIGHRFPLLHEIDIGPQLAKGSWVIVLFQHSCSHCQAVLPRYADIAESQADGEGVFRVALVEVPPHDPSERSLSAHCTRGRLNDKKQWFVVTPTEILLKDGDVVGARTSVDDDVELEQRAIEVLAVSHRIR